MVPNIFNRGSIPVLEKILHFTAERHKVIVSNIANVTTPFYRAMDLPEEEFKKALFEAIRERDERPVPVFEFQGTSGIRPKVSGGLEVDLIDSPDRAILNHQENNVDIDKEMARMSKNSGLHNTVAQILSQQFNMLRSAINERVMG